MEPENSLAKGAEQDTILGQNMLCQRRLICKGKVHPCRQEPSTQTSSMPASYQPADPASFHGRGEENDGQLLNFHVRLESASHRLAPGNGDESSIGNCIVIRPQRELYAE
jgi:hypothetical protein